jgi:hypothetical protein
VLEEEREERSDFADRSADQSHIEFVAPLYSRIVVRRKEEEPTGPSPIYLGPTRSHDATVRALYWSMPFYSSTRTRDVFNRVAEHRP